MKADFSGTYVLNHQASALNARTAEGEAGRRLRMAEALRDSDHDQDNLWIFERQ